MLIKTLYTNAIKVFKKAFNSFRAFLRRFIRKYVFLNVSNGNLKLKADKNTKYIVWNLPAVVTCPYATEHCKKFCYARKAEKAYPGCLDSRKRNFAESLRADFAHNMVETISELCDKKSYKNAKRVVVRIHESGDFYNENYANKWLEIARLIADRGYKNVVFMAYTKSLPYFENKDIPANFRIRASVWDDTKPELLDMSEKYPIYTAYSREEMVELQANGIQFFECKCENCSTCNQCWSDTHKLIVVEIH